MRLPLPPGTGSGNLLEPGAGGVGEVAAYAGPGPTPGPVRESPVPWVPSRAPSPPPPGGNDSACCCCSPIRDPGPSAPPPPGAPQDPPFPPSAPSRGLAALAPLGPGMACRLRRRRRRRAAVRAARANPRHRQARPPCPRAPNGLLRARGRLVALRRLGAAVAVRRRLLGAVLVLPGTRARGFARRLGRFGGLLGGRRRRRLWRRARARQRCSPSSPCSARRAPRARPGRGRRTCPPAQRTRRSPPGCAPGSPPPNPSDPPRPPVPARRPPPTSSTAPAARCAGGGATWTPPGA